MTVPTTADRLRVVGFLGDLRADLTLEQRVALVEAVSAIDDVRLGSLALSCVVGVHNGAQLALALAGINDRPTFERIVLTGDADTWPFAPIGFTPES